MDPLAVLLAGVWTRTINAGRVREKAEEILDRAQYRFRFLTSGMAYPARADEGTRKFIRYWFDDYARRQLFSLASTISRVHCNVTRDALWCGFSRLIITKSSGASLAMDLSHSRPHREFKRAPVKPFDKFKAAVEVVVSNCPQDDGSIVGPPTVVTHGDARKLAIDSDSIDLVLTSPPYLNGIDYIRCSKFSLVWMGHTVEELREIRSASVGTEVGLKEALASSWVKALIKQLRLRPALSERDNAMLARYVQDISGSLSEVTRVLRKTGRAFYVIGDSTSKGTFIRNSAILSAVANHHGLKLISRHSRKLPENRRYLPPPGKDASRATLDGRLKREVVLVFKKSG